MIHLFGLSASSEMRTRPTGVCSMLSKKVHYLAAALCVPFSVFAGAAEPGEATTQVVSRVDYEPLNAAEIRLKNGVRVHLKSLYDESQNWAVQVSTGHGKWGKTSEEHAGLALLAELTFLAGGTADAATSPKGSNYKDLGMWFNSDHYRFKLGAITTEDRFTEVCDLMCEYLSNPGFDEKAMDEVTDFRQGVIPNVNRSARLTYWHEVEPMVLGWNDKKTFPSPEAFDALTMADLKAWLAPQLTQLPLEVEMIGSFTLEEGIAICEATFGQLVTKPAPSSEKTAVRPFPKGKEKQFKLDIIDRDSYMFLHWPVENIDTKEKWVELMYLREILQEQLSIRVNRQLGDYSSISIEFKPLEGSEADACFLLHARTFSGRDERFTKKLKDLCYALKTDGIQDYMVDEFRYSFLPKRQDELLTTSGWLGELLKGDKTTLWLEAMVHQHEIVPLITAERMQALMEEIFVPENHFIVAAGPGKEMPKVLRPKKRPAKEKSDTEEES